MRRSIPELVAIASPRRKRLGRQQAEIRHGADTREVDIGFQDRIVCGNFVDEEQPTYLDMMHSHYEEVLGDRYVPMAPDGGWLHD